MAVSFPPGSVAAVIEGLPATEVWSLDHLDRCIWLLGGRGLLARYELLGCWIVDHDRFACVLRHPDLGDLGTVVHRDTTTSQRSDRHRSDEQRFSPALHDVAAWLDQVEPPQVARLRDQGWTRAGIAWDTDPSTLTLPWLDRPPRPDDPLAAPEVDHTVTPTRPRSMADPFESQIERLESEVVHPMWASTLLARIICAPIEWGSSEMRLAAVWAAGPDTIGYIETHLWPPPDLERDQALLSASLEPGQQHLRFGEFLSPIHRCTNDELVYVRHDLELDAIHTYPRGALGNRVLVTGTAWQANPDTGDADRDDAITMTHHLHHALDRPTHH